MRAICLFLGTVSIAALSSGCMVTYPVTRTHRDYHGAGTTIQNRSFLVTGRTLFPRYLIQAKTPEAGMAGALPEGTGVAFRSFWRLHVFGPETGWLRKDYAVVTVTSPSVGRVNALLFASDVDDVFNGDKYRPKPVTGQSNDPLDD